MYNINRFDSKGTEIKEVSSTKLRHRPLNGSGETAAAERTERGESPLKYEKAPAGMLPLISFAVLQISLVSMLKKNLLGFLGEAHPTPLRK